MAKQGNNGAKVKLLSALASGPKSIDELERETGLTRMQIATNARYLKDTGLAVRVWALSSKSHVAAWIQTLCEAVEEARA